MIQAAAHTNHNHSHPEITVMQEQRRDPTRTLTLRNRYASQMRIRFTRLRGMIRDAVVEKDVFGIAGGHEGVNVNQLQINIDSNLGRNAFDFPRVSGKVSAFMEWLDQQVGREILQVSNKTRIGQSIDESWQNVFIEDSYKRGVQRSAYELKKEKFPGVQSIEARGGIQAVMGMPMHADRLGVIFTRSYTDLKGITDAMDMQISRVLSQGLADGDGPRLLARKLTATIGGPGATPGSLGLTDSLGRFIPAQRRAEMLARTEVINAHHQGMVQEYRNYGLEGVQVVAEFRTAGDNRVCVECDSLQGTFYTLDEVQYLIPVHPMCRCIALPARAEDVGNNPVVGRDVARIENPDPENLRPIARTEGFTKPGTIPNQDRQISVADNLVGQAQIRKHGNLTNAEKSYLDWYSGDGFRQTNDFLRNPQAYAGDPSVVRSVRDMSGALNSAINKRTTEQAFTTFRGVNSTELNSFVQRMGNNLVGKRLNVTSFQSTALDESIANTYAGLNGVKFRINVPKGSNVINLQTEGLSRENIGEILFPNKGHFVVRRISKGDQIAGGKVFKTIIDVDYVQ